MPIEPSDLDRMVGRPWRHKTPPKCPECGYNLTGLTSPRCPECGTHILRKEVERQAHDTAAQLVVLKGLNDVPEAGKVVAIGAAVLLALSWAVGLQGTARVFGVMGGFATFGLGLSVLRALRVSAEVREQLSEQPKFALGICVAAAGVLLIVVSCVLP